MPRSAVPAITLVALVASVPLTDRNPQTFVPNIFEAGAADFVKATMRVYHAAARASRIEVMVLK